MRRYITVVLLVALVICASSTDRRKIERFQVIWNAPSETCIRKHNVTIPLKPFGIKFNPEQKFYGNEVVLFYETKLGLYPYVANHGEGEIVNGGIPQKVNMVNHFIKMRDDINKAIPSSGFDGVAVIDWEEWRPLWGTNWGKKKVYKKLSEEYARSRYPHLSKKSSRLRAVTDFNKAARNLMIQTIRFAIELRPFAKWGFYGFPYCDKDAGKNGKCNQGYRQFNNRMQWLFDASVAVYPSIYLTPGQLESPQTDRHTYVQAIIEETIRVTKLNKRPFFTYTKFAYHPYTNDMEFYKKDDLCSTLKQTADMGGSGIVVWSSSHSTSSAENCRHIAEYVDSQFGPYASVVTQEAQMCANQRCFQHGVCRMEAQLTCTLVSLFSQYRCDCDENFRGFFCERHQFYSWVQ
uniref:Hyaluronidase n=1 Tax=Plectus sambesii TaxID=2011161 RepID=A0A914UJY4_9BILA